MKEVPHINKAFATEANGFKMKISEIFDLEDEKHDFFQISRKRVYLSILDRIVDDLKFVCREYRSADDDYENFMERYAAAKIAVGEGEQGESEESLIDFIDEFIVQDEVLQHLIRDRVNREYTITIETNSNGSEELQFKDSYAKLLICSSMMCRIAIPLICAFMERNDVKKETDLTVRCFTSIFGVFSVDEHGDFVDLPSKLNCFIGSAVENTQYSDKVIWGFLENLSINDRTLTMDLFRKIVRDTLPKLDINRSVVSFFHVVIRQQIMFTFTQNVKINFRPISPIRTENSDGGVSPFTRMEMRLVATDEMQYVMEKEAIRALVERVRRKHHQDEHEYYLRNVAANSIQIRIVSAFANSFDRVNVMLCNREEYVWLLMETRAWLLQRNMKHLAAILIAGVAPREEQPIPKKGFSRSKIIGEVLQSKAYENIISRFPLIQDRIEDSKTIVSIIGDLVSTKFVAKAAYGEQLTKAAESLVDVEAGQRKVIGEFLSFLERF